MRVSCECKRKRFETVEKTTKTRFVRCGLASAPAASSTSLPLHTPPHMPPHKLSLLEGDDGSDGDAAAAAPVKLRVNESFAKRLEVRRGGVLLPSLHYGSALPRPRWSRAEGCAGARGEPNLPTLLLLLASPPAQHNKRREEWHLLKEKNPELVARVEAEVSGRGKRALFFRSATAHMPAARPTHPFSHPPPAHTTGPARSPGRAHPRRWPTIRLLL